MAKTFAPVLPRLAVRTTLRAWPVAVTGERLLMLGLCAIGFVAQGINMFNYPAFGLKDDEGIYMEQAWAVLREQSITHYTYTYDHAPAGWLQLALWLRLVGGPFTFGNAIDTGRVLMLLLHLAMIPLLYGVVRRFGGTIPAAALGAFVFSVSPLAVFYQRMVLLDNFMLFWILLGLWLLLDDAGRLSRVVMSGFCFGLAFLSKETTLFVLPAVFLLVWLQRRKHQGAFAVWTWVVPFVMVVSLYPLMAGFKGELFPGAEAMGISVSGDPITGVSLVGALQWQATRKDDGSLLWQLLTTDWLLRDGFLLIGGAIASVVNIARGILNRKLLVVGLLGLLPIYYLARGGVVFNYYVAFAIPFLCLNLALLASFGLARLPLRAGSIIAAVAALALLGGYLRVGTLAPLYTERPGDAGHEAEQWIKSNVPAASTMIIRDDMWTDFHEPGLGGPAFPNAHPHWKVADDPAVYHDLLHDDWHTVDYIVMSPGLEGAFALTKDSLALDALAHATLVKRWESPLGDYKLHPWETVELWKVDKTGSVRTAFPSTLLKGSTAYLTATFDHAGAYVGADGTVTAESQANALLRAVWSNDEATFSRVWGWTQSHMLNANGLLVGRWANGGVTDSYSAADADSDCALALLMASKLWHDPTLQTAGQKLVRAIWQYDVLTLNGTPYMTAGDWATAKPVVAINPSYFSPAAYRIFQQADPTHKWAGVIDSSYLLLTQVTAADLGGGPSVGLPPDWFGLERSSGRIVVLPTGNADTTRYGYDAPRIYWRVELDRRWSNDPRAAAFLRGATFVRDEVTRSDRVGSLYDHDGSTIQNAPSMVGTAGALAAVATFDYVDANILYGGQIAGGAKTYQTGIYWGDPTDLYTQEWGWFATAMYADLVPNIWHDAK